MDRLRIKRDGSQIFVTLGHETKAITLEALGILADRSIELYNGDRRDVSVEVKDVARDDNGQGVPPKAQVQREEAAGG